MPNARRSLRSSGGKRAAPVSDVRYQDYSKTLISYFAFRDIPLEVPIFLQDEDMTPKFKKLKLCSCSTHSIRLYEG
jgi:hypothetical protein